MFDRDRVLGLPRDREIRLETASPHDCVCVWGVGVGGCMPASVCACVCVWGVGGDREGCDILTKQDIAQSLLPPFKEGQEHWNVSID